MRNRLPLPKSVLHGVLIASVAAWCCLQNPAEAQDCDEQVTTADIALLLDTAESQYVKLEVDEFQQSTAEARRVLSCLSDPLPRFLAARWHRFQGLLAFTERNSEESTRYFAAARSIEPAYTFPESFIPEEHPVLQDYKAIDVTQGSVELVLHPKFGYLTIDGRGTVDRPMSWPTIVQLFQYDGSVVSTHLLQPEEAMPEYEPRRSQELPPGAARPVKRRAPLLALAGGALVASVCAST